MPPNRTPGRVPTFVLGPELYARVERYARIVGSPITGAVRALIVSGLDAAETRELFDPTNETESTHA